MFRVLITLLVLTEHVFSFNPIAGVFSSYNLNKGFIMIKECRRITQLQSFINESSSVTTIMGGATTNTAGQTPSTSTTTTTSQHKDHKDNLFQIHSCVKIITPNIKAFHVSSKGFGSFSQDSTSFIPAPENAVRKDKCLVLPIGLIGKVTQIYDSIDSDSSLPLQVKFTPGESGTYDVPVAFTMHLDTSEVEVVIS